MTGRVLGIVATVRVMGWGIGAGLLWRMVSTVMRRTEPELVGLVVSVRAGMWLVSGMRLTSCGPMKGSESIVALVRVRASTPDDEVEVDSMRRSEQ